MLTIKRTKALFLSPFILSSILYSGFSHASNISKFELQIINNTESGEGGEVLHRVAESPSRWEPLPGDNIPLGGGSANPYGMLWNEGSPVFSGSVTYGVGSTGETNPAYQFVIELKNPSVPDAATCEVTPTSLTPSGSAWQYKMEVTNKTIDDTVNYIVYCTVTVSAVPCSAEDCPVIIEPPADVPVIIRNQVPSQ